MTVQPGSRGSRAAIDGCKILSELDMNKLEDAIRWFEPGKERMIRPFESHLFQWSN